MPTKTLATLAVACLAASIAPASAGGLLGHVLSHGGDGAPLGLNVEHVVDATGILGGGQGADADVDVGDHLSGIGGIAIDTDFHDGIDATVTAGEHQLADVSLGGGEGIDVDIDLGLDHDGSDLGLGTIDLGGGGDGTPGGIDLGNVADVGGDGTLDGVDLGNVADVGGDGTLDGIDLGNVADLGDLGIGVGDAADVGDLLDLDADDLGLLDLGDVTPGGISTGDVGLNLGDLNVGDIGLGNPGNGDVLGSGLLDNDLLDNLDVDLGLEGGLGLDL